MLHSTTPKKTIAILVCISLMAVLMIVAGCGAPGQRVAKSDSRAKNTGNEPKGGLVVDDVRFFPIASTAVGGLSDSYFIVARLKNTNPDFGSSGSTYTASLYNAKGVLINSISGRLGYTYPGEQRWFVSNPMTVQNENAARAEFEVRIRWRRSSVDTPPFKVIKKKYVPEAHGNGGINGALRYTGTQSLENVDVNVLGVLLNDAGEPLNAGRTNIRSIAGSGDYPFEIPLWASPAAAADTSVTVVNTGPPAPEPSSPGISF
jgi:hypothetical protein